MHTTRDEQVANRSSSGTVVPGFEAVQDALDEHLNAEADYSAQLCVYWRGQLVVDLWGGPDMAPDSITGVFSASKGVAALCIAYLVDRGDLELEALVSRYWPEFAAAGKDRVTVRELLSHQVGLFAPPGTTLDAYLDSRALAATLADTRPIWRPGKVHGYHGLTVGVFMEELVRRTTGTTLQELYDEAIRIPFGIDFFLGLPEAEEARYRNQRPMEITPDLHAMLQRQPGEFDGISMLAGSIRVTDSPVDIPNRADVRRSGPAAAGGVGSARGLASAYAAVSTGIDGRTPAIGRNALEDVAQEQVFGTDRVLRTESAFATVFQKSRPQFPYASAYAFGHNGAGGALGYADPLYDLAFGYIPQRMEMPARPNSRSLGLSTAARTCAAALAMQA